MSSQIDYLTLDNFTSIFNNDLEIRLLILLIIVNIIINFNYTLIPILIILLIMTLLNNKEILIYNYKLIYNSFIISLMISFILNLIISKFIPFYTVICIYILLLFLLLLFLLILKNDYDYYKCQLISVFLGMCFSLLLIKI